ncbi:uncharacterized protein [Drosophila kikkawai]|uniref:Uncharacterized protein n=1 Tax=Drosophila kikkawai TaxID=30033 RepID=A0A6P4HW24_DROKI|nr:uncharacterized protein LOC108073365 [Drosophila kikkawai]
MENEENQLQPVLNPIPSGDLWADLAEMTRNSEQLMESVTCRLNALNSALDRLEDRTDRVLVELRQLVGTENQVRRARDGCGDPGADE